MKKKDNDKGLKFLSYFAKYKFAIFCYVLVMLLAGALVFAEVYFFSIMIEKVTIGLYADAIKILLLIIVGDLIRSLLWYIQDVLFARYSLKISAEISNDLTKKAFSLTSTSYSCHSTGTFTQRIISDANKSVSSIAYIVAYLVNFLTSLISVVYITILNIYIGLVFVIAFFIALVVDLIRIKKRRKLFKKAYKKYDKISSIITEIIKSEKDIKSLGLEEPLSKDVRQKYDEYNKDYNHATIVSMNFSMLRNNIIEITALLALILGIYLVDVGLITLATFVFVYSSREENWELVLNLSYIFDSVTDTKLAIERMNELYNEVDFVDEKFGKVSLDKVKGKIEFKNVKYTYKELEQDNEDENVKKKDRKERKMINGTQVFANLNFTISPNTTVAFVGKSGSGKSTILNLMSKLYEVDDGEVLIDGVNINDLDKKTLRNSISLVNQFPYIFDMTIKENLLLVKQDATEEELHDVLRKANLQEFVASLPKGIDTIVGESGVKLSGGQKQRLAVARALLRNSSIIIFDESTSSLDNFAQQEIKKSIDNLKGQSTIVIVAHRLSTIKDVDTIYFLDKGEIVSKGTFDELFVANEDFKAMFYAEKLED